MFLVDVGGFVGSGGGGGGDGGGDGGGGVCGGVLNVTFTIAVLEIYVTLSNKRVTKCQFGHSELLISTQLLLPKCFLSVQSLGDKKGN